MPRPDQSPAGSAREVALRTLRDIDVKAAYANLALDANLSRSRLAGRDRGLATELAYGTTRRRAAIDWAIEQVSSRPLAKSDPWTRNILREGAYQILYMDRIPHSAAVDEAVDLARKYGHEGVARFVNGVLRNLIRRLPDLQWPDPEREGPAALAIRHSYPQWLVEAWSDRFGVNEAVALLEAGNKVPALTIRANGLKATRAEVAEALQREGVETEPSRFSPQGLHVLGSVGEVGLQGLTALKQGLFMVQDESSMLVGPALDPQPGWTVIDMAAAPGGKSTHLADLMQNRGRVIAVDIHPHKIDLIDRTAHRMGAAIVETVCMDGRAIGARMESSADAVLCDLPCSGLGTLARRADARWRKQPAEIPQLTALQRELLDSAARALKPGGVLVYSTCTIHPAENQEQVAQFLGAHPEFRLDDLQAHLPAAIPPEALAGGTLQLLPHLHGTDGFFIARLTKETDR